MANAGKYALTTYTGDGSTTTFPIGFPYLDVNHVIVYVAGNQRFLGTHYTISADTLNIVFVTAPTSTQSVQFRRVSSATTPGAATPPYDLLSSFPDGAPATGAALKSAFLQIRYQIQELRDDAT